MKTVLVFKTSVTNPGQISRISPLLNNLMEKSERWNFDLEDCDNILRVEAISLQAAAIINNLNRAGFSCVELED